jgi:hypothetical protein
MIHRIKKNKVIIPLETNDNLVQEWLKLNIFEKCGEQVELLKEGLIL